VPDKVKVWKYADKQEEITDLVWCLWPNPPECCPSGSSSTEIEQDGIWLEGIQLGEGEITAESVHCYLSEYFPQM